MRIYLLFSNMHSSRSTWAKPNPPGKAFDPDSADML